MRRQRITITLRSDVIKNLETVIDGQKIKNRSNAIETILLKEFKDRFLSKAIILGRQFSAEGYKINGKMTSKVLAPIGEKTLIEKNIEWLKNFGVNEIIITTDKFGEQIKEKIGDGTRLGIKITYVPGRGTAEVLNKAQNLLNGTFLMANGDILLESIDIADMYHFHTKNRGQGTIAVATVPQPSPLGSIYMKGDLVTDFKEKVGDKEKQSHLINAGVYILEPTVSKLVPSGFSMVEKDLLPKLAAKKKLFGYQIGKNWVHLHDEKKYRAYIKSK